MFGVLRSLLCRRSLGTLSRCVIERRNVFTKCKRDMNMVTHFYSATLNGVNVLKRQMQEKRSVTKMMIAIMGTFGILSLGNLYYGAKMDPVTSKIVWNIRKAYAMLFSSILAVLSGSVLLRSQAQRMNPLVLFAAVTFWLLVVPPVLYSIPYEKAPVLKYMGMLLCVYPLSLSLAFTSAFVPWALYRQSLLAASALFAGLLVVGSISPMGRFDSMIGVVNVGSVVLFAICVASLFSPLNASLFSGLFNYIGLPVVTGMTLILASNVKKEAVHATEVGKPFDPINCVIPLVISFVNMIHLMINQMMRRSKR